MVVSKINIKEITMKNYSNEKKSVVYKEWALGILWPNNMFAPLHINRSKPALSHFGHIVAPFKVNRSEIRMATLSDFNRIGVKYHSDYVITKEGSSI